MAFYTDTFTATNDRVSIFAKLKSAFTLMIEAQSRGAEAEKLMGMTDKELGAMGLSRDTIVRHVYRDIYYI